MLAILFYLLLAYLLYRFVFGFVVPIVRTTRQVKRSFRDMNSRMNGGADPYGGAAGPKASPVTKPASKDDYIDFEEIKE